MNKIKETRYSGIHMVDILFVLGLFCIFAASSVVLIVFGADIYKKIVSNMDENFSTRTSVAYITEKIHQSDQYDSIIVCDENGSSKLIMKSTINDIEYATSLYEYDGYLYELFARTDIELPIDAGQQVIALHDLNFEFVSDNLLKVSYIDDSSVSIKKNTSFYVSLHSGT